MKQSNISSLSIPRRHPLAHTPEPDSSKMFPEKHDESLVKAW
jgi:hypothetical protein